MIFRGEVDGKRRGSSAAVRNIILPLADYSEDESPESKMRCVFGERSDELKTYMRIEPNLEGMVSLLLLKPISTERKGCEEERRN